MAAAAAMAAANALIPSVLGATTRTLVSWVCLSPPATFITPGSIIIHQVQSSDTAGDDGVHTPPPPLLPVS